MKELFNTLQALENRMAELDEQLEKNPEDEKIMEEWDATYKKEFDTHEKIVKILLETLKKSGMKDITRATVNAMMATRRDQLLAIVEMI